MISALVYAGACRCRDRARPTTVAEAQASVHALFACPEPHFDEWEGVAGSANWNGPGASERYVEYVNELISSKFTS